MNRRQIAGFAAGLLLLPAVPAAADTPFSAFQGAWKGSGSVRLENGKSENIKCNGYYTVKDSGTALGLAINCANPSVKIHMRAHLAYAGGNVSGTWEEREFNQNGNVSGTAAPNKIKLSFSGAISGSMSVLSTGSGHTVSISTGGPGFTGINLRFTKSG